MAEQEGLTDIRVTWTPPSSGANGYIIFYDNSAGTNGSEPVDGGSTDSHTLTGLQNGATYTIAIVATSQHLPSEAIERVIVLGKVYMMVICDCFITTPAITVPPPDMLTVDREAAELGPTTITLSWTVPDGSVVTGSLVMWELASSGGSSARAVRDDGSGSELLDGTIRRYTIRGLRSSTTYHITVTLINPAGNSSLQITLSTTEGKYTMCSVHNCYQSAQVCYCSALTEGPSSELVHVCVSLSLPLSLSAPLPLSPLPLSTSPCPSPCPSPPSPPPHLPLSFSPLPPPHLPLFPPLPLSPSPPLPLSPSPSLPPFPPPSPPSLS